VLLRETKFHLINNEKLFFEIMMVSKIFSFSYRLQTIIFIVYGTNAAGRGCTRRVKLSVYDGIIVRECTLIVDLYRLLQHFL